MQLKHHQKTFFIFYIYSGVIKIHFKNVVQSLVYRRTTEERINKRGKKSHPRLELDPGKKHSLFPDEKHIWLTSRHIFSQAIAHLLWGCDVSGGFFIYLIVYFQRLQRWVDELAVKAHTHTMILTRSFSISPDIIASAHCHRRASAKTRRTLVRSGSVIYFSQHARARLSPSDAVLAQTHDPSGTRTSLQA